MSSVATTQNNSWVYVALRLIAIFMVSYQALFIYDLIRFELGLGSAAARPFLTSTANARVIWSRNAALVPGDEILAINDAAYRGRDDETRAYLRSEAGETWKVRYRRGAEENTAQVRVPERDPLTVSDVLIVLVTGILTPLLSIVIGLVVVFIRPRDRLAWILLYVMTGFAHLTSTGNYFSLAALPPFLAAAFRAYHTYFSATWGIGMALWGMLFPDASRLERMAPWLKWVVIVPIAVIGITAAMFEATAPASYEAGLKWKRLYDVGGPWLFWLNSVGATMYFSGLGFRMGFERRPDALRRLRLLYFGSMAALMPIFAMILVGKAMKVDAFSAFPIGVVLPVLLALAIFPATMAYVVVVERALDLRAVLRAGCSMRWRSVRCGC